MLSRCQKNVKWLESAYLIAFTALLSLQLFGSNRLRKLGSSGRGEPWMISYYTKFQSVRGTWLRSWKAFWCDWPHFIVKQSIEQKTDRWYPFWLIESDPDWFEFAAGAVEANGNKRFNTFQFAPQEIGLAPVHIRGHAAKFPQVQHFHCMSPLSKELNSQKEGYVWYVQYRWAMDDAVFVWLAKLFRFVYHIIMSNFSKISLHLKQYLDTYIYI